MQNFVYISSFRRLTLLASPTPKYCFKGVGEAGPKNEGEAEIEFLINFHAIFYLLSTSKPSLINLYYSISKAGLNAK